MGSFKDLTGKRFERLLVIGRAEDYISPHGHHNTRWLCKCDCGNIHISTGGDLKLGKIKSCGCLMKEITAKRNKETATHGLSQTRLYGILHCMHSRCYTLSFSQYKDYGGRGIRICDQWNKDICGKNAIINFSDWAMSHGYKDNLTIDRINNDGWYTSSNCRWVTRSENNNNKRNCRFITFEGKTQTITQWAKEKGIKPLTLRKRIVDSGWSVEKAINTPVQRW